MICSWHLQLVASWARATTSLAFSSALLLKYVVAGRLIRNGWRHGSPGPMEMVVKTVSDPDRTAEIERQKSGWKAS